MKPTESKARQWTQSLGLLHSLVGKLALWAAGFLGLWLALYFLPNRFTLLTAIFGINILLAQSINLLVGYSGQISLGHAALFGIGAYTTGYLTTSTELPVLVSIPAAVILTAAIGGIIAYPAGRVREFYLAMVTVGFLLIMVVVFQQWSSVTGGFSGLARIPSASLGSLEIIPGYAIGTAQYLVFILLLVTLVCVFLRRLIQSNSGRSLLAIEQSDTLAASLGIDVALTKRKAWVVSSAMAGLAGALYAHLIGFIAPETFGVLPTVVILIMAVLGGMGTVLGPILGAAVFTYLPDRLQAFADFQLLAYGLILMFSFVLLPRGMTGLMGLRTPVVKPVLLESASEAAAENPASSVPSDGTHQFQEGALPDETTSADSPEHPGPSKTPEVLQPKAGGLLFVDNVSLNFGGVKALDELTMSVAEGTIHGLIGPNGSGKTSLVNVITGLYKASSGEALFRDQKISDLRPDKIAGCNIARTFQRPQILEDLTVAENVALGATRMYSRSFLRPSWFSPIAVAEERDQLRRVVEACSDVGLLEQMNERAGSMSFGIRRLIEVARCIVSGADFIILDEPAAGLTEEESISLIQLLRKLRDRGTTTLVIDHNMSFLLNLVDRVTVLDHGVSIFDGPPDLAREDARVVEAYLGAPSDA